MDQHAVLEISPRAHGLHQASVAGAVCRRILCRAHACLHRRHVRHRRHRHGESVVADHVGLEQAAVRQAGRAELYDGRGQQRRETGSLVRSPQYSPLCQYAADPRRPRLSARRRHADHPARRPQATGRPVCACRPMSRRTSSFAPRSMLSRLTNSASCRSSRRSTWWPDRRRAGRRSCLRSRSWASRSGSRSSPRICGAIRPRMRPARSRFNRSLPLRGLPDRITITRGEGPRVIENLVADERRRSRSESNGRWPDRRAAPTRFAS